MGKCILWVGISCHQVSSRIGMAARPDPRVTDCEEVQCTWKAGGEIPFVLMR